MSMAPFPHSLVLSWRMSGNGTSETKLARLVPVRYQGDTGHRSAKLPCPQVDPEWTLCSAVGPIRNEEKFAVRLFRLVAVPP